MMTNTRKFGLLLLAVACLVISVATMLAIVVLRNQASLVTNGVWTRGGIITLWLLVAARRTTQGSTRAYRRLRGPEVPSGRVNTAR
jgi:hypothetical protein